ncbi:hypothetical protein CapIbe_018131 [Capra ibex]
MPVQDLWIAAQSPSRSEMTDLHTKQAEASQTVQRNLLQILLQGRTSGFFLEIEEIDSFVCYQTKRMRHRGEVISLDTDSFGSNWHRNTGLRPALFLSDEILPEEHVFVRKDSFPIWIITEY